MFKKKLLPLILATVIGCQSCVMLPTGVPVGANSSSEISTAEVIVGAAAVLVPVAIVVGLLGYVFWDISRSFGSPLMSDERRRVILQDLRAACRNGNEQEVKRLLQNQSDYNVKYFITEKDEGECPLFVACERGHLEVVKYLIGKLDLNSFWVTPDIEDRKTMLHAACQARSPEIFKCIVNEKIRNINNNNLNWLGSDETPLHIAAECGREDLVRWLINEKGANKDAETRCLKKKPVIYACKSGNQSLVRYFIDELQVDIANVRGGTRSDERWRLLFAACESGNLELVKWLVNEKGLDTNTRVGCTMGLGTQVNGALYAALKEGKINVARWLVDVKGVSMAARETAFSSDENNNILLIKVCEEGDSGIEAIRFFASKGVNIQTVKDKLLKNAAKQGKFDLLKHLVEEHRVTDLNAQYEDSDDDKNTLLHYACKRKDKRMITYLLDKGARADIKNRRENTAFHVACEKKDLDCVKLLVEKGNANINEKGGFYNRSPLESYSTDEKIKKYLQERVKRQ